MPRRVRSLRDLDRERHPTDWSGAFFLLACLVCFGGGLLIGQARGEGVPPQLAIDGYEREAHWKRITLGLHARGQESERLCAEVDAELHRRMSGIPDWSTLRGIVMALEEDGG